MVTKIASQLAIPLTTVSRIRFWFRVDSIVEKALQMEGRVLRGKRKGIEIIRIWFDSRIFAFVVHKRGMASSSGWSKRHERFFVFPIPSFAFAVMHRDTDIGEHGSRVVLSTPVLSPRRPATTDPQCRVSRIELSQDRGKMSCCEWDWCGWNLGILQPRSNSVYGELFYEYNRHWNS